MARRAPLSGDNIDGNREESSTSSADIMEGSLSRTRAVPSYRTAVGQSAHGPEDVHPGGWSDTDDHPAPWMVAPPTHNNVVQTSVEDSDAPRGMWPPSNVVKEDRGKATAIWMFLLVAFVAYVVYVTLNSVEMRKNPPVKILRKDEPFQLPDVVFCPSPGDGCDASEGSDCLPLDWFLSSLEGLSDDCNKYFATPSPAVPTPVPVVASPPVPGSSTSSSTSSGSWSYSSSSLDDYYNSVFETPSPVVRPGIRYNVETTASDWCPRLPLSECAIDYDGVDSGSVRSLHASFYVLWDDMVSSIPLNSTRRFINMFFVDQDMDVTDAVVAVRLPYDRVNITGTDPFTFSSNDVILSMSQYVHLTSSGKAGRVERTYTQATTTAQHTLRLDSFEGEEYEGALLYVTLSVNNFAYQSIEEVDPVDWWALLGAAGGVWEIICVTFGVCFVVHQAVDPEKKWVLATSVGKEGGGGRRINTDCRCCMKSA